MDKLFLSVLNMSLTASFVIAAIMLARLTLKKAPKIISYALWAVVGFRMVFPFTLESIFSLMPIKAATIPQDIATQTIPRIDSGIRVIDNAVSAVLPAAAPSASVNPLQILISVGSIVWILGAAVMLIHSIVSIVLLKRGLRGSVLIEGNTYKAGNLKTPFVIGLLRPRIYIPDGLPDDERRYVVLHEQTHIRRRDHVIKMLAYLVLCLHWFNPLAWTAFILMGADMEMSCDERVMKALGGDIKKAYSLTLVRVAAGRKILNGSPLAFGEGGMKERVKNVLNFKKRSRAIITLAVAFAAVLTVGFAVSGKGLDAAPEYPVNADGLTYGSSQYAHSAETLPDLISAGSIDGIEFYLRTQDIIDAMPITVEEAQDGNYLETRFTMYAKDGKTVVGNPGDANYSFAIQFLPAEARSEYAIPAYPVNANGQTYGTSAWVGANNPVILDLVACTGIDGTEGYVYATDLDGEHPKNPEEAIEYMSRLEARYEEMRRTGEKYVRIVPLYAEDGVTVIGEFGIGGLPVGDMTDIAQATGVFMWPSSDSITIANTFGVRAHPIEGTTVSHDGIDIVASDGTPILAADNGTIAEMSKNETDGYYIWLDHGNGFETFYAQMQGFVDGLKSGDTVKKGDIIGFVGSTGESTGPHLHFGVSLDGNFVNPLDYFSNYQLSPTAG